MIDTTSRSLLNQFRTLFSDGALTGLGEGELLDRFVQGRDEPAFEELIARHGPMVLAVCRRWLYDPNDVEDAFQATFLVLVRKAAGLRDRRSVAQWLFGVSHRVARQARASAVRRRGLEMRMQAQQQRESGRSGEPDPSDELAGREVVAMVDQEILRLPTKQREAALLCLVQGMSHQAAAQALGWPLGTFKTRVAEARATLARRLSCRGVGPTALAVLARSQGPILPRVVLPDGLTRRALDAAIAGTRAGRGTGATSVAGLARRVSRGMFLARIAPLVLGVTAACALAAPGWFPGSVAAHPKQLIGAQAAPPAPPAPAPRLDHFGDPIPAGAVMRLGTSRHRQGSPIWRIAYAPDGQTFVTDGEDSLIRVWNAAEGRMIRQIDAGGALADFGLTSNGRFVMTMTTALEPGKGFVHRVMLIDLATGRLEDQASWLQEDAGFDSVAICADRRLIALGTKPGGVRVLDAWTGAETVRFETGRRKVQRVTFSRDGKRLAVEARGDDAFNSRGDLIIFDLDKKQELRAIPLSGHRFSDLVFTPDGAAIAALGPFELAIWKIAGGDPMCSERTSGERLSYSADGRILIGVSGSGDIGLFAAATGRKVATYSTGIQHAGPVALSPDAKTVMIGNGQGVVHAWELGARRDRFSIRDAHDQTVNTLLFTRNGRTLITGSEDATVRLWDLGSGRQTRLLRVSSSVKVAACAPDGQRLAVATAVPHCVFVWDLASDEGPVSLTYGAETPETNPLVLRFVDDRTILLIDWAGKLHRMDIKEHRDAVGEPFSLAAPDPELPKLPGIRLSEAVFLPGGTRLAAHGVFTGLHLVEIDSGKVIRHAKEEDGGLLQPSPDGRVLATARSFGKPRIERLFPEQGPSTGLVVQSSQGAIRLLDAETCRELRSIPVDGGKVWAMGFSPDGKTLAATSGWETGQIHFYEVDTGQETRTIDCPPLRSPALAFTPDGSRLVSGMADGSILVWDVRSEPAGR